MKIEVPTKLNDITLEQYQAFDLINNDEQDKEFKLHKTISIFTEVDMDIVSKFPIKDAEEIAEDITIVLQQDNPFNRFFTLDGVKYGFLPSLEDISLGEYIDLEDGLKDTKSFHKAAAVMFRPIVKNYGDLYTIAPYEATLDNMELMKKAPLGCVTGAVVFPALFEEVYEGEQGYSREDQFAKKYGWFNSLFALSGGDITKYNEVTKINHLTGLLFLEYNKEKADIEAAQYKRRK